MLYPRRIKDPEANLDYRFVWGQGRPTERVPGEVPWLDDGETISSFEVTVPAGLTIESQEATDDSSAVLVWLSGGTAGTEYEVRCRITTSASRTDVRRMTLSVEAR
ncbi:phage fiber-tail adaptor protein [Nocardia brasiliensis]|uniref:phage fiber-tail adaptor protein n=1 Tax=Nocardia brasiliensis TaxID=37326 RepID=UPI0011DDBA36|nr:hypothetical protein [Nocardia brasiliensis]